MELVHSKEVELGNRFEFGKNWKRFLKGLNEEQILEAEESLKKMLAIKSLKGKSFLDAGSGSGLFSLAARRLGAKVHSFDYDPNSVICTKILKDRFFQNDDFWVVEEGSVLDEKYLSDLGKFDFVYSWGVLHHTGDMHSALENIVENVAENGYLFIAIYNDQDMISRFWRAIKRIYCSTYIGRCLVAFVFFSYFTMQNILVGLIKYRNPVWNFKNYKKKRGMSIYYDWVDWLGGYPFEVSTPEEIFYFYRSKGFVLENLITTNRLGCNQFVFKKLNDKL